MTRRVATDSAGLPFLAIELINAVVHGLDLLGVPGSWPKPLRTLDQTMPGELPDALIAAVRIAFRRLSAEARQVLAVAAVAGDRVTAAGLAPAVDLDRMALEAALDELEWDRWLAVDARGYSFVARITREIVVTDLLTGGQRQRIRARLESAGR